MNPTRQAMTRRRSLDPIVALLLLLSVLHGFALRHFNLVHDNDFKHIWGGSRMLVLGANPYDAGDPPARPPELVRFAVAQGWTDSNGAARINPFVYLPTTGLLLLPLTAIPFDRASSLWFWFNGIAAWLLVLLGPSLLRVQRPDLARLAGAAFLLTAHPFLRQMSAGQMNVMTAWIVLGALAALRHRRPSLAGALLAVGFAWKIAPAFLIAALAALGRRRACLVGATLAAALWLASLSIAPPRVQADALRTVAQMGYGRSTWSQFGLDYYRDAFNQSPNALFHHLLTENPRTTPWIASPPGVANAATALFSVMLVGLWLARRRRLLDAAPQNANGGEPVLFLAASLAMLMLPSLMWDHYVVQTLPALLWLAGDARTARRWPRALGLLASIALLGVAWNYEAEICRTGPGIVLMSLRLWPILGLYAWLLFDRPPADDAAA
jgi:hypothetical protein